MSNEVHVCQVCFRTDCFSPGTIDHDKEAHKSYEHLESLRKQNRMNLRKHFGKQLKAVKLDRL